MSDLQNLENNNTLLNNINIQVTNIINTVSNLPNCANSYLATANVSDIAEFKTAFINNNVVIGTYENIFDDITNQYINIVNINNVVTTLNNSIVNKYIPSNKWIVPRGTKFHHSTNTDWMSQFDVYELTSCSGLFSLSTFERITINSMWDLSSVTDMSTMFYNCHLLSNVYFNGVNVTNVQNMQRMFENCIGLQYIDFNIPYENYFTNVFTISGMFSRCNNLNPISVGDILQNVVLQCKKINSSYKNLVNTNYFSPFYCTNININTSTYSQYWSDLNNAGWTY